VKLIVDHFWVQKKKNKQNSCKADQQMYVTIERDDVSSSEDRSQSHLELLKTDAAIVFRVTVEDDKNEPDPSVVIVVEQLVNVDTSPQVQDNTIVNGMVNGRIFQWVECTNVTRPLFSIKNPIQCSNSCVIFDNTTGRSYLRIDIKNVVSQNHLQESTKVLFEPPLFTDDIKCPIFRFVFHQYQNGKNVHDPVDWIPPFVFGVFSEHDDIKNLLVLYNTVLDSLPMVSSILHNPQQQGTEFHVRERVRAALNRSGEQNYKPLMVPEILAPRQAVMPAIPPNPIEIQPQPSTSPPAAKRIKLDSGSDEPTTPSKITRTKFVLEDIMSNETTDAETNAAHALITPIRPIPTPLKRKYESIQENDDDGETTEEEDEEDDRQEENEDYQEEEEEEAEEIADSRSKPSRRTSTKPSTRGKTHSTQPYKCTVCQKLKEDQIGEIKRQVTRSNVYLYDLVFGKKISCGRVCSDCLATYNSSPCTLCGGTDFKSGTLSLKSDLIPRYEAAFGKRDLKEGKLCRGCYGKFYAYQSKSLNKGAPQQGAAPKKMIKTKTL
jgi:hypothetical protein